MIIHSSFFVRVTAYRFGGNPDNYGQVILPFQVNEPPVRGNCTAFPSNGTAIETLFNVECSEFYDQHKPVMYQVNSVTVLL